MKRPGRFAVGAAALLAVCACLDAPAQSAALASDFEVAYRAWDLVTEIARHNRDPALGGECARTFRSVAVPALRRQTKVEQDAAAAACHRQARALCANQGLARTSDIARKCAELK